MLDHPRPCPPPVRRLSRSTAGIAALPSHLYRRTGYGAIGAEDAAITLLGAPLRVAARADVEPLAGVCGHDLCLGKPALWAGDDGITGWYQGHQEVPLAGSYRSRMGGSEHQRLARRMEPMQAVGKPVVAVI